jgi:hypothetical protein
MTVRFPRCHVGPSGLRVCRSCTQTLRYYGPDSQTIPVMVLCPSTMESKPMFHYDQAEENFVVILLS